MISGGCTCTVEKISMSVAKEVAELGKLYRFQDCQELKEDKPPLVWLFLVPGMTNIDRHFLLFYGVCFTGTLILQDKHNFL